METDKTTVVDSKSIITNNIRETLIGICEDLKEHGYNPIKQIVAYIVSGDPGYISSYKECRNRIMMFKKEDILETILVDFVEK